MAPHKTFMAYLQLIRVANSLTAASNILAAYFLTTAMLGQSLNQGSDQITNLILLIIASVLLYSSGMIMNDCFDYEEDLRERSQRPLPNGQIPLSHAWCLCGTTLIAGLIVAAMVGITQFIIAATLAVLIIFYNGVAKQTNWAPWLMGSCRYSNWILGLSLLGLQTTSFLIALPVFLYVSGLTLLSRIETSASDTRPLIQSILLITASGLVIALLIINDIFPNNWTLIALLAAELLILYLSYITWHEFNPTQIQQMVKILVIGIIPLDAILVWGAGNLWGGLIILSLLIPTRLLAKRMYVT